MSPEISQTCMTKSDQTVFFFPRYHGEVGFLCLKFQFYHSPLVVGESSEAGRAVSMAVFVLGVARLESRKCKRMMMFQLAVLIGNRLGCVCVCMWFVYGVQMCWLNTEQRPKRGQMFMISETR